MQLQTLLSHCAQLFRIIRKSPQPSDILASQYLRQKKYIGSKERRFISELTFSSLRLMIVSEIISQNAFNSLKELLNERAIEYSIEDTLLTNEILIVSATYIICSNHEVVKGFKPKQLLEKVLGTEVTDLDIINSLQTLFTISSNNSEFLVKQILIDFEKQKDEIISLNSPDNISQISDFFSIPSWIIIEWTNNNYRKLNIKQAKDLAESLLSPANTCIRANEALIQRDELIIKLSEIDIDCRTSNLSPSAIILNKRYNLNEVDLFKAGYFEVQDEGSQLISFACAPESTDTILDACAGAGGKTLHLASLQNDHGTITAWDLEYNRLKEIKKRQAKYNYKSIRTLHLNPNVYAKLKSDVTKGKIEKFDLVLVDAPCSGMGTVRRMPMLKYRLTPELLSKISRKQLEILSFYSNFVKSGGFLVYATCSLMTEENESVADKFFKNHSDFEPYSLSSAFEKYNINIPDFQKGQHTLSLLPSIHETDGFFIAKFQKNN